MAERDGDPRALYAADRTVLAAERTDAAWVGTGLVSLGAQLRGWFGRTRGI